MAEKASQSAARKARAFEYGWDVHKDGHCIWIVTLPGYVHSQAFNEVATSLSGAFSELGGSAPVVTQVDEFKGRSPIIFGGNLLPASSVARLPAHSVVVNLEQVLPGTEWLFSGDYQHVLRNLPVIDYSSRNRDNLALKGIDNVDVLEIGYHPSLSRVPQTDEKDIDVLFYGSLNQRRIEVLQSLTDAGLKVVTLFGEFGAKRDVSISRAKVVLNMHFYESGVFEIVRVSYLLANKVCVLTEGRSDDPDLQPFTGGLASEPYERLVQRCIELCRDAGQRAAIAEKGHAAMKSRSQAGYLRELMMQRR